MNSHHFITYSPVDGEEFAQWLRQECDRCGTRFPTWFDAVNLTDHDEGEWIDIIVEAIQVCSSLFLVLTNEAHSCSRCKPEWKRALKYRKPIVILRASAEAEIPPQLEKRKCIDFTINRIQGFEELKRHILWLSTLEGQISTLQEQLDDAERDIQYARENSKPRFADEITRLKQQIRAMNEVIEDPEGSADRLDTRISSGIEIERRPRSKRKTVPKIRFINPPPTVAPRYFQDRFIETKLTGDFLKDEALRILTISGPGGVGKTVMVCRVLKSLQGGKLPDDGGELKVSGIIYLSEIGNREITFSNLFSDLLRLLEPDLREQLALLHENPQATVPTKLKALIPKLPQHPIVILMDNFENAVDSETFKILNPELNEALNLLLKLHHHPIKIIITTRVLAKELAMVEPGRQMNIPLDKGLESPYAENVLKEMDFTGHVGLRDASMEILGKIRLYTRGVPRALEAFFAILKTGDSIEELLDKSHPHEQIVQVLVGEAFSRLPASDQKVMQALAIYGFPVPAAAVDFLLKPWIPHIDSGVSLKRLVSMHLVRREGGDYYLHPVDREHALSRLMLYSSPQQQDDYPHEFFDLKSLKERASDYWDKVSLFRDEWDTLDDITPQVRRFDLRLETGDDDTAASTLEELRDFIDKKGAFQMLCSMAAKLQDSAIDPEAESAAAKALAIGNWRIGNIPAAIAAQKRAIEIAESLNNEDGLMLLNCNLLIVQMQLGVKERAIDSFKEYLSITEQRSPWNIRNLSVAHDHIADLLLSTGYLEESLSQREQALKLAREEGEIDSIEAQTHNLGNFYKDLGNIEKAMGLYLEALKMSEKSGNPLWKANHLDSLASCFNKEGNTKKAIEYIEKALEIRREIGDLGGEADNTKAHAEYLLTAGKIDLAKELAEKAMEKVRDLGRNLRGFFITLAEINLILNHLTEAKEQINNALELQDDSSSYYSNNLSGIINIRIGDKNEAKTAFRRALDNSSKWLKRSSSNPAAFAGKGLALAGLAACGAAGSAAKSVKAYQEAKRLQNSPGVIRDRLRLFDELAKAVSFEELSGIRESIGKSKEENMNAEKIIYPAKNDCTIVFFAANPAETGKLALDMEAREITSKIRSSDYRDNIEFVTEWAVRPDDLLDALNMHEADIVHFSGHGTSANELILSGDDGKLKPISMEALESLFNTMRGSIRLVFLNACFSIDQAEAIAQNIDCVIGMNKPIGDGAAIVFAAAFYRALGFGRSVKDAFEQGKTALMLEGIQEHETPEIIVRPGADANKIFLVSHETAEQATLQFTLKNAFDDNKDRENFKNVLAQTCRIDPGSIRVSPVNEEGTVIKLDADIDSLEKIVNILSSSQQALQQICSKKEIVQLSWSIDEKIYELRLAVLDAGGQGDVGETEPEEEANDKVFISYSREDQTWVKHLLKTMAPLIRKGEIDVWHDGKIQPGQRWREEIEKALQHTRVAVLMVSRNFLDSDFINEEELNYFLNAEKRGTKIIWILIEDCLYEDTDIFNFHAAHDTDHPLKSLEDDELNDTLVKIARKIRDAYKSD
ncbi:MAG: TIR domain-containing protein [Candidatus Aminicenantes bacterium]|nr:TIR domain-containing protein [Candidatus Aminicenantes bacterium]